MNWAKMTDGPTLLNPKLLWPVLLGCALLWTIFIWKEWSQRREIRFWVKIMTSFIGLSCLGLMMLKPALPMEQAKGRGIVLTEGFQSAQLDSLRSKYKGIPVERYAPGEILKVTDKADSLFLLGNGLRPFDFWQMQDRAITFLGAGETSGWSVIRHEKQFNLGEALHVRAEYMQPKKDHWAILLDNAGNPLDSILFEETESQELEFTASPKASGRFVYALVEKDQDGTIASEEPLPIIVENMRPLKVLMVNDFPTFETKYLKNFLAEMGHEVSVRSQLTRNKYKFEYFNTASKPVYQFTQKDLEDVDLLIIDADSYADLSASSRTALEKSVEVDGLGLFVQPNTSLFKNSKNSFLKFNVDYPEKVSFSGSSRTLEKYPYMFREDFPVQSILMDSVTIASYLVRGKGKMASSVLRNSYQLILEGDQGLYARLWTKILDRIVRKSEKLAEWESLTEIPHIDEPLQFYVRTRLETPQVQTEGALIPLQQDLQVSSYWQGTTYPRKQGWNQLEIQKDSIATFPYYVFSGDERKTVSQRQRMMANIKEFGINENGLEQDIALTKILQPIAPVWFYALFLLCMGWLWLEPKLSGQ